MADRVWNLYMIAVHPDYQGQGRGTELPRYVEDTLQASGQWMLLIETSGLSNYDRTRALYIKRGYEQEARIHDFWTMGDDKIVFRKVLTADFGSNF
jgi:ribosomal protein S18 acetylase RimI-like enzyme